MIKAADEIFRLQEENKQLKKQVENEKKKNCITVEDIEKGIEDVESGKYGIPFCRKSIGGKFLLYDKQWLYDNLEYEFEHLMGSKQFIEGRVIHPTDDHFDVQKFKEEMSKVRPVIMPKKDNRFDNFIKYLGEWIAEHTSYYHDNESILDEQKIMECKPEYIKISELGLLIKQAKESEDKDGIIFH